MQSVSRHTLSCSDGSSSLYILYKRTNNDWDNVLHPCNDAAANNPQGVLPASHQPQPQLQHQPVLLHVTLMFTASNVKTKTTGTKEVLWPNGPRVWLERKWKAADREWEYHIMTDEDSEVDGKVVYNPFIFNIGSARETRQNVVYIRSYTDNDTTVMVLSHEFNVVYVRIVYEN